MLIEFYYDTINEALVLMLYMLNFGKWGYLTAKSSVYISFH